MKIENFPIVKISNNFRQNILKADENRLKSLTNMKIIPFVPFLVIKSYITENYTNLQYESHFLKFTLY